MNFKNLLESANPYESLQNKAKTLAQKWVESGLLEGLKNEVDKNNMAMLLENQAKQLVIETSLSGGGVAGASFNPGTGEQWAGVALPLVRRIFAELASKEWVSVQPMNLPSGLVFYLDFKYGTNKAPFAAGDSIYGASADQKSTDLNKGFYGANKFTYSINNTSSLGVAATVASASWADVNFNSDLSASVINGQIKSFTVALSAIPNYDANGVRGFVLTSGSLVASDASRLLPALTKIDGSNIVFFVSGSTAELSQGAGSAVTYQLQTRDNARGDFEDRNNTLNGNNTPISIPEINISFRSDSIVAKSRKLKAQWTPELAQDLNAYQSIDAEAELTSILSEYITMEIDLEILDMLIESVIPSLTDRWSAQNNQFINPSGTGFDQQSAGTGGYYNSQGQWFQTIGTKIQKISNKIHQLTLRGGANFLVTSPTVCTILESIPGYAADTDGDKMEFAMGVQKIGSINSRFTVYKNPYMTENIILEGFRGSQFLECGAVYAPYIPLIMTPLVYDPETFTPRKGIMTRYAKKMVRNEYYGKIIVAGLNTI